MEIEFSDQDEVEEIEEAAKKEERQRLKAQRDQARQEAERLKAERQEAIRVVGHRLWSHPLITTMDESHRDRISTVLDSLLETGARPSWKPQEAARREVLEEVAAEFERKAADLEQYDAQIRTALGGETGTGHLLRHREIKAYRGAAEHCREKQRRENVLATLDPSGEEIRSDNADQAAARRSSHAPALDGSPCSGQPGTEGGSGVGADPSPARSRTRSAGLASDPCGEERRLCPDEGICHHDCAVGKCFRVHHCAPLSTYGEEWERETVEAFSDPSGEGKRRCESRA